MFILYIDIMYLYLMKTWLTSTQDSRRGRGWVFGGRAPPLFEKKKNQIKKNTFSNIRNLWWNKNIRLGDLAEAFKFMIGPFQSYIIYYKTALSRRLSEAFSPARWCSICTNNRVFFFIKVLKSPRSYDFLKQIELDDIVDNMKKFQELPPSRAW